MSHESPSGIENRERFLKEEAERLWTKLAHRLFKTGFQPIDPQSFFDGAALMSIANLTPDEIDKVSEFLQRRYRSMQRERALAWTPEPVEMEPSQDPYAEVVRDTARWLCELEDGVTMEIPKYIVRRFGATADSIERVTDAGLASHRIALESEIDELLRLLNQRRFPVGTILLMRDKLNALPIRAFPELLRQIKNSLETRK